MKEKKIYPKLIAGSWGEVLNDFRENVKLSVDEMDQIIVNHNFTQESLEETHRLLKILWNYQMRETNIQELEGEVIIKTCSTCKFANTSSWFEPCKDCLPRKIPEKMSDWIPEKWEPKKEES